MFHGWRSVIVLATLSCGGRAETANEVAPGALGSGGATTRRSTGPRGSGGWDSTTTGASIAFGGRNPNSSLVNGGTPSIAASSAGGQPIALGGGGGADAGGTTAPATNAGMSGLSNHHEAGRAGAAGSNVAGNAGAAGTTRQPSGGSAGNAGAAGAVDIHVDPIGDGNDPGTDLLEAHVYWDGSKYTAQAKLAGNPLASGGAWEVSLRGGNWEARLALWKDDERLTLRWFLPDATICVDTCAHVSLARDAGWATMDFPAGLLPTDPASTFTVGTGPFNNWDTLTPQTIPIEFGAAPDRGGFGACTQWSNLRRSTVHFNDVSLGRDFGCGLDDAGTAHCWGTAEALAWVGAPPSGPFRQIAVGNEILERRSYACAMNADGAIQCWGDRAPSLSGSFSRVSDPFGCAIHSNGLVSCIDEGKTLLAPLGATDVYADSVGFGLKACAITKAGEIRCASGIRSPEGSDFVAVELGDEWAGCGLLGDGILSCADGYRLQLGLAQMDWAYPTGNLHIGCGVTKNSRGVCWGRGGLASPVPSGRYSRIEVGTTGEAMCAIARGGILECWDYGFAASDAVPATTPP